MDIIIKLLKAPINSGPFEILNMEGNELYATVSRDQLIDGFPLSIPNGVQFVVIKSIGVCKIQKLFNVLSYSIIDFKTASFKPSYSGCVWRHQTDAQLYNDFYGVTEDYILEYPFSYQYQDEIVQNVQDYTKVYKYSSSDDRYSLNTRMEIDNQWFTHSILYNGQQSSGLLKLTQKPKNNLSVYNSYPKYFSDHKEILYTKSDNFYQYNTFWAINKSPDGILFNQSCKSLSIDKDINQDEMNYSSRSFNKAPLRAKDLKIRHILRDVNDTHLVSQFLITSNQQSFK